MAFLRSSTVDSTKFTEDFLLQVSIASAVQHENLMRLIAYGSDGTTHILAYEFPSNFKTLYDVLHSNSIRSDSRFFCFMSVRIIH